MANHKGVYTDKINTMCRTLDRKYGKHWPHKIDLEDFDVGDPRRCVLGQLFGSYMNGFRAVSYIDSRTLVSNRQAWDWGVKNAVWPEYSSGMFDVETQMIELQHLWTRRIKYLQGKRSDLAHA